MKKRILGTIVCFSLIFALMPTTGFAEEETEGGMLTYLALGDSITTGYGLGDEEECFVNLFAEETGMAATVNAAVDGLTASALAEALTDTSGTDYTTYLAAISAADVITVTAGGNDLMGAFYTVMTEIAATGGVTVDADTIQSAFADPSGDNLTTVNSLLTLLNSSDWSSYLTDTSTVFADAVASCVENIDTIAATIKTVNPDAVILVANQYNPYQWLGDTYGNISNLFETGVIAYNTVLLASESTDYTVADVYSEFAASEDTLTNAVIDAAAYSFDFDFHPNAEGHTAIASVMASAYESAAE
ncbi:MAG: GDSL-type esterase/lipase family protein [Lachnospiraceae bacterium]|nr:GDSL-type esterase/lipase family protein [Lachnospiraceae bacterium]